jgi:hypothetical protein
MFFFYRNKKRTQAERVFLSENIFQQNANCLRDRDISPWSLRYNPGAQNYEDSNNTRSRPISEYPRHNMQRYIDRSRLFSAGSNRWNPINDRGRSPLSTPVPLL